MEFKYKNTNVKKNIKAKEAIKEVIKVKEVVKSKVYIKSKRPQFVWESPKGFEGTFDEMIENYNKEHKNKGKAKTEFVSNRDELKADIRSSKNRVAKGNK
jgi:hypothetical protein